MVQRLGLWASAAKGLGQSLVEELRWHKPQGIARKEKKKKSGTLATLY